MSEQNEKQNTDEMFRASLDNPLPPEGEENGGQEPSSRPTPRAWRVPYADLGLFNIVGTSQEDVVGTVADMKKKARNAHEDFLFPVDVIGPYGRIFTVYLLPANLLGVFEEFVPLIDVSSPPSPPSDFGDMMKKIFSGDDGPISVVEVPAPTLGVDKSKENDG